VALAVPQLKAIRTLLAHVRAIAVAAIARAIALQATKGALIVYAELLRSAGIRTLLLQALIYVHTPRFRVHAPPVLTLAAVFRTTSSATAIAAGHVALCAQ